MGLLHIDGHSSQTSPHDAVYAEHRQINLSVFRGALVSSSNDLFARAEGGSNRSDRVGYINYKYGGKSLRSVQEKYLMLQIKRKLCIHRKDYSQKRKAINGEDKQGEKGLRADTDVTLLLLDRLVFVKYLE